MTSVVFQSRTSCKVTFIADIIAPPWYDLRSHKCSGLERKKNDCGWFHIHQTLQVCAAFLKMLVFKVHFVAEEWQLKNTMQAPYNALYQLAFFVSHFNVLWSLIVLIHHSMVHRSHVELSAIKDWQTKPDFSQSELKASLQAYIFYTLVHSEIYCRAILQSFTSNVKSKGKGLYYKRMLAYVLSIQRPWWYLTLNTKPKQINGCLVIALNFFSLVEINCKQ